MRRALLMPVLLHLIVFPDPARGQDNDGVPFTLAVAAGVGILAIGIHDIATAAGSAHRTNQQLELTPSIDPINRRVGVTARIPLGGRARSVRPNRNVSTDMRSTEQPAAGRKSPSTAFGLSLGATAGPVVAGYALAALHGGNDNQTTLGLGIAAVGVGALLGPSVGHWYAGQTGRGWATFGARLGLAVAGLGLLSLVSFD